MLRYLLATAISTMLIVAVQAASPLAIQPRTGDIYVIAHRGAHQNIPENTLPAYAKAIELGADFIEIDLRTTRDGELVSIHNATVGAYVQDGFNAAVRDLTLDQLRALDIGIRQGPQWAGQRVPTLDEILELSKDRIGIYLDLKDASIQQVARRIVEFGMERQVVWCISPDRVKEIRAACPNCIPMPDPESEATLVPMLSETRPAIVAPVWSDFSSTFSAKCQKFGAMVFVDEQEPSKRNWQQAIDWGADGIQTDDPQRLIEFLRRRRAARVGTLVKVYPKLTLPDRWQYSAPLIAPERRSDEPSRAQKDPTVVYHDGRWHVFMTVKLPGRSAIEHCSFRNWEDADRSARTILSISDSEYYCAPQVFYFAPHQKWYLVYQMGVPGRSKMWVAYSTTSDIDDPNSWTQAKPMLDGGEDDPRVVGGLDYWIICDTQRAYLFFTSLNGKMWRMWTELSAFPHGFDHCELALQGKIFEASHTYRLKGRDQFLTIIEENGRRHYKAYLADRLDGQWRPLRDTEARPFAGAANVRPAEHVTAWTDNISHGELLRDGIDQTLTVDPAKLRFLFQGMLEKNKGGKGYGQFQWRLGLLTPVATSPE